MTTRRRETDIQRRQFLQFVCGSVGVWSAGAGAQSRYPRNVVMLATHSSPGGGSDVFLREMAPHLSRILGATVVVDNIAGGSGAKAMATVAAGEAGRRASSTRRRRRSSTRRS